MLKCSGLFLLFLPSVHAGDLVRVPGTTYPVTDPQTNVVLRVTLSPFRISTSEIVQREYRAVTGGNPSRHQGDDLPVENVSWWDAVRYCNLRSLKEGLEPCYDLTTGACDRRCNGYRLPTEAEWAWAAADHLRVDPERKANLGVPGTTDERELRGGGTTQAGTHPANRYGLFDMSGNVWEWCTDFFNIAASPSGPNNPDGAAQGVERVIRGGSFRSTRSRWAGSEYRSGMDPARRSPYTGFRVARSEPEEAQRPTAGLEWSRPFNQPPVEFESSIGGLTPLLSRGDSLQRWTTRAGKIRAKWNGVLGTPGSRPPAPSARLVETRMQNGYLTRILALEIEPGQWERAAVTYPARATGAPLPVLIIPFYDVDSPIGMNAGGRRADPLSHLSFAHLAAQRGMLAVSVRWFAMAYGEGYAEAMANLAERHPGCTGLGKWVWDSQRLLDYLETLPEVDHSRIGVMGWSLGAKMALYAAAFDERIKAAVSIEGGIGLSFSNYGDYWYLGTALGAMPKGTDQHELIGLIAPRAFLLLGGDKYDNDQSWHYINAARPVYALFGQPENLGFLNYRGGHRPTPGAIGQAFEWLSHVLVPGPVRP